MSPSAPDTSAEPSWARFVDGLRAFVARRVPAQDAEDVSQDVLLRLHRNASSLRDPRRLQAWIYSVARYAIADYYRGDPANEAPEAAQLESVADPGAGVAEKLATFRGDHSVHEEVLSWLRPMADGLAPGYREALLLADFEGRTQREVADTLGLSLPGAKSRVQRARRMLASELERCCAVEFGADGRVEDFQRHECDC